MNRTDIIYITLSVFIIFCIGGIYKNSYALSMPTKASLGGKIVTTSVYGMTCTSQYAITHKSSGGFPIPAPLTIQGTKESINYGSQTLGLIDIAPNFNTCYITTPTGPIYMPSWSIDTKHFKTTGGYGAKK